MVHHDSSKKSHRENSKKQNLVTMMIKIVMIRITINIFSCTVVTFFKPVIMQLVELQISGRNISVVVLTMFTDRIASNVYTRITTLSAKFLSLFIVI